MGQPHQFRYCGGNIALDLANTVAWRLSDEPEELLGSYDDLVRWARGAELIDDREAATLRGSARRSPQAADAALRWACDVRELCYRLFESAMHCRRPAAADVEAFNGLVRRAMAGTGLRWHRDRFLWERARESAELDGPIEPVVRAAAELLSSDDAARIAQCHDDRGCGWVFLDRSRAKHRRWCSMADCGNRNKAKRHYHRKKAVEEEGQAL